jgi:hypothetical protein
MKYKNSSGKPATSSELLNLTFNSPILSLFKIKVICLRKEKKSKESLIMKHQKIEKET